MTSAFLDTTAVVNLAFLANDQQKKVKLVADNYSSLIVSNYVLFELSRGFLRNLLLLQRKLLQLHRFSDAMAYGANCRMKPYLAGTILNTLIAFFQDRFQNKQEVSDETMMAQLRSYVDMIVIDGSRKLRKIAPYPVNEIGCIDRPPDPIRNNKGEFVQDLKWVRCGEISFCGLKKYCYTHRATFEEVRAALTIGENQSVETVRRIKALRELYRNKQSEFGKSDCHSGGDALIAHEAARHTDTIITSNKKDFLVLGRVLNLTIASYG